MSEPLTDRKRAMLEVLAEERAGQANDLSTGDVNLRALKSRTRQGRCATELGDLADRFLVERVGLTKDEWRITDAGVEALG